jgi:hypothetical protein
MSQFYAKAEDEERCLQSSIIRQPIMVQGLTTEGKLRALFGPPKVVIESTLNHQRFCANLLLNPICGASWLRRRSFAESWRAQRTQANAGPFWCKTRAHPHLKRRAPT